MLPSGILGRTLDQESYGNLKFLLREKLDGIFGLYK